MTTSENSPDSSGEGRLEILFASSLNLLDEMDRTLPHGADDVWPEGVSKKRNDLVWLTAENANRANIYAYVSNEKEWPVVYIELSTGQVSWHVPTGDVPPGCRVFVRGVGSEELWDGHDREEKARRIETYLEQVHYPRGGK